MTGDVNKTIFLWRNEARLLMRAARFAQMLNLTGPPGTAKSTWVRRLLVFFGEGVKHLAISTVGSYLTNAPRQDVSPHPAASSSGLPPTA